ncbi:acetate kinase [bacterium]
MKILVLNCGSSSIKYKLISMTKEIVLAKGLIERIGTKHALIKQKNLEGREYKDVREILDHSKSIEVMIEILINSKYGSIKSIDEIDGVGHRVVHGGDKFSGSVLITDEVRQKIKDCIDLAPLHNPNNLKGINAIRKILPNIKQVGSFDTAFHQTLPEHAYLYPIPYRLYKNEGIRRYGFHGSSHRYVCQRASEIIKKPLQQLKLVSCHLGNGCSITAVDKGKSVDTSMGFTPLEGLMMGTRSGDIDPAIIFYLASKMDMTLVEIDNMLNKYSGILGISGLSNDMREIEQGVKDNCKRSILAMQMFSYKVKKYIGSYAAALNGCDAIIFTGGIGENTKLMRHLVCKDMDYLNIKLDTKKNGKILFGKEGFINTNDSKTKILVISTDEELVIARDTRDIIKKD